MIHVKLIVLFLCLDNIREICSEYCAICPKHTLCMYKNPGPNPSCKFYDKAALITKDDVQNIVSKINQRRNFVALGLARNLPSAANMNKMEWSEELATFAQRWVDQCDGAIRPDREDFCRDLADAKVGQNIATVTGYSPGLSVKSFVEIWFIEALDYTGSVTYYNESLESKTNYFTQLIWAETRLVGCGKARFSIDERGTMVDRLICNFAPRGNIQGKPVYTIGYPATQCNDDFQGDEMFTGLCKPTSAKIPETTLAPAMSSLLRILNPPNRLIKPDIDPIQNDAKEEESLNDVIMGIGHQKIRHAPNQTHLIQHEIPHNLENTHAVTNTASRHDVIPYHHTIDHLQNIHGAVYKTKQSTEHYRRHYFRNSASPRYGQNQRFKSYGICTRNSGTDLPDTYDARNKAEVECTRGLKGTEYLLTTKPRYQTIIQKLPPASFALPHDTCSCNSQKTTCSPSTTPCTCNLNCHCLSLRKYESGARSGNAGEYVYYDIPDLPIHGAKEVETRHLSKQETDSFQTMTLARGYTKNDEDSDHEYFTRKVSTRDFNNQKIQRQLSFHRNYQDRKYPHSVINLRKRNKRQTEEPFNDKPFWQVDENKKQPQLKSLRYTTLSNNRRKKFRATNSYQTWTEKTEPITIQIEDETEHQHDVTEKFLSFDELMHLRKINGGETGFNIRRAGATTKAAATTAKATAAVTTKATTKAAATTAKTTAKPAATTTKATAQTTKAATTDTTVPTVTYTIFKPLKLCSRKVTCTWTAPTVTDSEGRVIDEGKRGQSGSRTPPGYVDGCTRTSTCTREFMNRNRLANSTDESGNATPEDEDYCERRSLDLERKDGSGTVQTLDRCETHTESITHVTKSIKSENAEIESDCSCDDQETRSKRNICFNCGKKSKKNKPRSNKTNSDDYYYLFLGKILRMINNKHKRNPIACSCSRNVATSLLQYNLNYLFTFLCIKFAIN